MKISELNHDQKCHLAWRLEHYTHYGYGTSCRIARGEEGDMEVEDAFKQAECRNYRFHARKVAEFVADTSKKKVSDTSLRIYMEIVQSLRLSGLSVAEEADVLTQLIWSLKNNLRMCQIIRDHPNSKEPNEQCA